MVLNRVPPASLPTVRGDLLDRLRAHGLQGAPLFVVPDVGPHEGLLSAAVVAPIQRWLAMLAGPDRARTVIGRTLRGSLAALRPWVDELAEAVQAQADAAGGAGGRARRGDRGTSGSARRAAMHGGAVADGAVRARWAELTSARGAARRVVRPSGRVRGSRADRPRAQRAAGRPLAERPHPVGGGEPRRRPARTAERAAAHASRPGPTRPRAGRRSRPRGQPDGAAVEQRAAAGGAGGARVGRGQRRAARSALAEATCPPAVARQRRAARPAGPSGPSARSGEDGLAAVALAAAAGVEPARALLVDLLGDRRRARAVTVLRDDLADRCRRAGRGSSGGGRARRWPTPTWPRTPSSLLRLRLAVLKGLT